MASPQITVRVDPELYKALVMLARTEEKTLANFTRDLIEDGLKARRDTNPSESNEGLESLKRLEETLMSVLATRQGVELSEATTSQLEQRLTALILKAIKAAAAAQFYARMAAIPAQDLASIWGEQISAMEFAESRKDAMGKMDADSQEFAQWWVRNG